MHPIRLGTPRDMATSSAPLILQHGDADFVRTTLDDLRSDAGRGALWAARAQTSAGANTLKLFQPVQRTFHTAVIEAWCDTPGEPRLDPSRVVAAGMVLRRVGRNGREGWMRSAGRARGWTDLARVGGSDADPAAGPRLLRGLTGVADIDRQLAAHAREQRDTLLDEDVIPLYVAPPDVCAAAGRTLFYGVVPTTSGEQSDTPAELLPDPASGQDFGPASADFRNHLPVPLQTILAGNDWSVPRAGQTASQAWNLDDTDLANFVRLLHQLGSEFDAFDGDVAPLRASLRAMRLPLTLRGGETTPRTVDAFDFLSRAAALLLARDATVTPPEMPTRLPGLSSSAANALANALHQAMLARFSGVRGRAGRFDDAGARYVLRAFVRLKCEHGDGTRVVWSGESQPFVIAPWYEGTGAPPVPIPLPEVGDLKKLKPNVSFIVPPALQNLLAGKAADLMEGKGSASSLGIGWICSFNIPIITICAFIVLNIFLSLFNLIFGWLFFIKICLPFPKFKKGGS